jgi:hypothetical protein
MTMAPVSPIAAPAPRAHSLANHQAQDPGRRCAHGDSHAEFLCALRDQVRKRAVEPDTGEEQRCDGKTRKHQHGESRVVD